MSHDPQTTRVTRLAPSPTGGLHLGNARTFLINWALARQNGWRVVLRIEDLDTPRLKPGADQQAIDDLAWLGMDWDVGPLYQKVDGAPYRAALEALSRERLIYPCTCTRQEILQAQSAPHGDEHELRYPGTCRPGRESQVSSFKLQVEEQKEVETRPRSSELETRNLKLETLFAWRVIAPAEPIEFVDEIHGPQRVDVDRQVGDFLVATKAGLPAYQLAVVVDDARQRVTDVVRGDDLLTSAGRQLWLYRLLRLTPLPRYWHLPLINGPDGRRLAKRHGDTRLAWCRQRGLAPERVVGLIASWCGVCPAPEPMSAREFAQRFAIAALPRHPVVFTPENQAWLLAR